VSKASVNLRVLVAGMVLLGAFLLFCLQPMIGKMALPFFGGAASVWTTALVFFQLMLLAGYVYADRLVRIRNLRTQTAVHLTLMAAAMVFLPIQFSGESLGSETSRNPVVSELFGLLKTVGLPYFMASTTAPLLQSWLSRTEDVAGRDPYFLYAASNTGSLVALLAYPFLIEPASGVRVQSLYWFGGYIVLVLLIALLAAILWKMPTSRTYPLEQAETEPLPQFKTRALWIAASFVPAGLMVGVTTHISINLTPMPLVWTVPLAVYLSTFILAFGRRVRLSARRVAQFSLPALVLLCPVVGIQVPVTLSIDVFLFAAHMILLFVAGLLCHTALAASRPHARHVTGYYVAVALGGVMGGIFAAIAAPMLFSSIFEYPLLLAAAVFFREGAGRMRWIVSTALAGLILGYALYLPAQLGEKGETVHISRNFYGVKKVVEDGDQRKLLHGDTLHGLERRGAGEAGEPMSYYHREGPLGDVMKTIEPRRESHVGVIGLGAGSIAAYASPSRRVTFIEIDPDVERIASQFFTFLGRCGASCEVIIGDGRLALARFPEAEFDLFVLDAFSSDAIPAHLLSREALALYASRLKPDGMLLFHVSNRYLEVKDLAAALVTDAKMPGLVRVDRDNGPPGKSDSIYVAAALSMDALAALRSLSTWENVSPLPNIRVWTDDYSSLIELLRWTE
jgi:SAM-dependent methyltransferase